MLLNEVKIIGKIYNPKERQTNSGKTITEFGLSIYAGKNKEGKNQYKFVNCKIWDKLGNFAGDQLVQGKLAFDIWMKDGKEMNKLYILADSVRSPEQEQPKKVLEGVPAMDDDVADIPF